MPGQAVQTFLQDAVAIKPSSNYRTTHVPADWLSIDEDLAVTCLGEQAEGMIGPEARDQWVKG